MIRRWLPILLVLLCATPAVAAPAVADDDPRTLIDEGHFRRAQAVLDARGTTSPEDPQTLYLQARLKLAAGDPQAALPLAERAATLAPREADYRYLVSGCIGTMAERAGKLKGLGLAKRFKREAEAALALDPRHIETHEGLIEFYSIAPGIAGGNDQRAYALAETLVRIDAPRGYLAQATLHFRDKHEAMGEESLRRALAAGPDSYRVRMSMCRFFATEARKKWTEAEEQARAALAISPGRIGAYSALAGLYAHLGRWDDLDRLLAEAERAVPDNRGPHYQAARTMLGDGREPGRAERLFRAYLAVEPEIGAPTRAHAHWRLGLVIEKQGRKSEALAEVQQALTLKPDLEEAKKDLKRLKKG